jgi:hypothetical protein
MTAISPTMRDWSYREAAHRLRSSAAAKLPGHRADISLDAAGNRVATCVCGWVGNGFGWLTHIDHVVSDALHE